jgi:hypothetical protein
MGHAYNEEAFQYLLGVQRKRSQRSDRPFVLLLVELQQQPGLGVRIEPAVARKLFAGLWRALREADVIGWYREEKIAGAVLPDLGSGSWPDVSQLIVQRVDSALAGLVPRDIARRLQIRVCQIQPKLTSS